MTEGGPRGTKTGAAEPPAKAGSTERRKRLPLVGLAFGVWATLPPFVGPSLAVARRVEIADHFVPGVIVLLVALAALVVCRRPTDPAATPMLLGGLTVAMAGLWMTATHVPLVAQALRDEVAMGSAAYHTAPGVAVLALGLVWAGAYWSDAA